MRVCVGPDVSWLIFVDRRPFPMEDGEDTISRLLCPAGERLTNLIQNHSAEAFWQVNDQREVFSPVTISDEVFLGEALDGRPGKGFVLPPWSGWYTRRSSRSGRLLRHDRDSHRAHCVGSLVGARAVLLNEHFKERYLVVCRAWLHVRVPCQIAEAAHFLDLAECRDVSALAAASRKRTVCTLDRRCLGTSRNGTWRNVRWICTAADVEALPSSVFSGSRAIEATLSPEHSRAFVFVIHIVP